jgi:putative CocE/NonD family hydrolase
MREGWSVRVIALDRLPRPIRELEHTWIELSDGCRLAARIWLPEDAEADPVPAVLEYLPYRKNDGTVVRDAVRQPHLAGHGYAAVRVDMRGTGESDGIIENEYTAQEHADGLEVIAWLAEQPWCSGSVGMTGISWGGFNSLQLAALRPPALKAIMTLCSTDDRYADDVHYRGGCVLALDMVHWASSMLAWNARPPDPRLVGESWRETWLDRLERTPPFLEPWLAHQRRDAYWKHGSVCEDYGAIECAVYAVGGWVDGYTNAVFRLLAGLSGPRKGLVGPWAHCFPDDALPGPSIGWLQECVRWWDHWLKGRDTGIMDEPMLRVWLQDSVPPQPSYAHRAGRWAAEKTWPSPRIETRPLVLSPRGIAERADGERALVHRGVQTAGTEAGVWCASGQSADLALDQRPDDALSLVFDSEPLAEPLELLGFPAVTLELEADRPQALVCVRLCDVFPDGTSALVSRGLLNLTHRESHETPRPLVPGERLTARVELDSAAWSIPVGHRLRIAVSSTYWPWAWPSPAPVTLTVFAGPGCVLELPVRPARSEDAELPGFDEPEQTPPLETEQLVPGPVGRTISRDLATGLVEQVFDWDLGGSFRIVPIDLVSQDTSHTVYSLVEGDPLSAAVRFRMTTGMARGDWSTRAEVASTMSADAEAFHVTSSLDAYEGATRVFARTWSWRFPRDDV